MRNINSPEGEVLFTIGSLKDIKGERQDITPDTAFLQMALIPLSKGKGCKSHVHIENIREISNTDEIWVILKGRIKAELYYKDNKIDEEEMKFGDFLITYRGGHRLEALEDDTIVYEIKNGPYLGFEKDKKTIG